MDEPATGYKKSNASRFSIWKKTFSIEELLSLAQFGDIKSLIQNIFLAESKANSKNFVFVKENQVYEFLPFLLINFPEAKYVYQVRNPRDMARSWKENVAHNGEVISAARQWKKDQQNSLKNYNELRKIGKAILVKYEDIISDTENTVTAICNFLGFRYEKCMLEFYKNDLRYNNASMRQAWKIWGKVLLVIIKKYLSVLNSHEIIAIEKYVILKCCI